ncbi:MAG: tetratricopeptide repeat protein [Tunicatimonas sp.]
MSSQQPAENRWNQIDRYVNGEMIAHERDEFEERMRVHAELAQQVHLHRDMLLGMEYHFMQQLKEQLALSDQHKKSFNLPLFLKIAAAVLLVAGLAGVAYYWQRPADPEQLFLTYFEAYPNTLTQTNRSDSSPGEASPRDSLPGEAPPGETPSDDASGEVADAMRSYGAGNFSQAAVALDEVLSLATITDDERAALVFYRGVANLQLGNTQQARSDLTETAQSDTLLAEPATWYTGLSYLREGDVTAAKEILDRLRQGQGDYAARAAELIDDLPQ